MVKSLREMNSFVRRCSCSKRLQWWLVHNDAGKSISQAVPLEDHKINRVAQVVINEWGFWFLWLKLGKIRFYCVSNRNQDKVTVRRNISPVTNLNSFFYTLQQPKE